MPVVGLVEKEDARIAHQPACQMEALLHAARELLDTLVGALGQPDALDKISVRSLMAAPLRR